MCDVICWRRTDDATPAKPQVLFFSLRRSDVVMICWRLRDILQLDEYEGERKGEGGVEL